MKLKYVLDIKRPNKDVGFAMKDCPELDHPPAIGSTLFPEEKGELNDPVETKVVEHNYLLTDGRIHITCELVDAEDDDAFTKEKGWRLNNLT